MRKNYKSLTAERILKNFLLEVGKDGYSQFLYLPCTQMQIEYALLRLDADALSDCSLSLTSDHFSDRMVEILAAEKPLWGNVDNLRYFATKFREIGTQEESYVEKLMDFVQPDNQKENQKKQELIGEGFSKLQRSRLWVTKGLG